MGSKSMEERAEAFIKQHVGMLQDFPGATEDLKALLRAIRKEALEEAASVVFSMGAAEKIRALIEEGGPEEVRS